MKATGRAGCPLEQRLPHFTRFLCATFQVCHPFSNGLLCQQPRQSQRPNHRRKFQFNHHPQGKVGEIPAGPKPQKRSLYPATSPRVKRKEQKQEKGTRRKTSPPYWIFLFSPLFLQTITLNPPLPGCGNGEKSSGKTHCHVFLFSLRRGAASSTSSTIGQSPGTVYHPLPAPHPRQLSALLRDRQDVAGKGIFFLFFGRCGEGK